MSTALEIDGLNLPFPVIETPVLPAPIKTYPQIKPISSGWDRTFLDLSSKCLEPICLAFEALRYRTVMPLDPSKFDNLSTKTKEIALRIFGAVAAGLFFTIGLPLALLLGVAGKAFRALGFALQKEGFTHIVTGTSEKSLEGLPKVATWNLCGICGGMHYDHGGVVGWKQRFPEFVEKIRNSNADVMVLQEVYDGALAEALIEELKGDFAHIYTHMGNTLLGNVGGLMVLSKCAVHSFTHTEFDNSSWELKRGFATVEVKKRPEDSLPCARIIGTHLIHDSNIHRLSQVAQIVDDLARRTLRLPTVLMGDLNIEYEGAERAVLDLYFLHGDFGSAPTCTNQLTAQWDPSKPIAAEEKIDYISIAKRVELPDGRVLNVEDQGIDLIDCQVTEAFDQTHNTKTAVSDHHMLVAQMVQR